MRAPLAPPRLSLPRNVEADAQAVETRSETDSPEVRISALESSNVLLANQFVIDCGNRVLPQLRFGDLWTKAPRDGTHVAVRQLVPCLGEGRLEFLGILVETFRNLAVDRVHPQREVCREHDRGVRLRIIVCVRHGVRRSGIRRNPLPRTSRALHQIPIVAK